MTARQYDNGLAKDTIQGCDVQAYADEIHSCATLGSLYNTTLAQFITYNPSVGLDCANIKKDQAYCVHVQVEPTTLLKPLPQATKKAPGTNYGGSPTCDMWQKVFPGDEVNKKETCRHLEKIWGIDDATLKKYNTDLAADCANIEVDSYLCVRIA
ncbi:hypothetical protein BLS_010049 [Venturia inaequalis]|uniref:LysM domain-containing protein n=1 Tax=Venturia inaequalis TaxID=5025 RepID=A0A8H3V1V8_VENIN|nr:hypothetical protein BLS_010049 [Venturia inaequalis]